MKKNKHVVWVVLLVAALIMPLSVGAQDKVSTIFFTEDMTYSAVLPDGWAADGNQDDGLLLANSEAALESYQAQDDSKPQPGDLIVQVIAVPEDQTEGMSPSDFLSTVAQQMSADSDNPPKLSEVEEFDFVGRSAVSLTGVSSEVAAHLMVYPFALNTYAFAVIATPPDELDAALEDALNLLATVRYSLQLDETYDDGQVSFNFPTDWTTYGSPPNYLLSNDPSTFDSRLSENGEGQYTIMVFELTNLVASGKTIPEATVSWTEMLFGEGITITDPVAFDVNGLEVITVDALNQEDEVIGGAYVIQFAGGSNIVRGLVFAGAPGQSNRISLTALKLLLGLQVAQP